jgi:hypothetical protein
MQRWCLPPSKFGLELQHEAQEKRYVHQVRAARSHHIYFTSKTSVKLDHSLVRRLMNAFETFSSVFDDLDLMLCAYGTVEACRLNLLPESNWVLFGTDHAVFLITFQTLLQCVFTLVP